MLGFTESSMKIIGGIIHGTSEKGERDSWRSARSKNYDNVGPWSRVASETVGAWATGQQRKRRIPHLCFHGRPLMLGRSPPLQPPQQVETAGPPLPHQRFRIRLHLQALRQLLPTLLVPTNLHSPSSELSSHTYDYAETTVPFATTLNHPSTSPCRSVLIA